MEGFGAEHKMIGDATETGMVRFAAARLLESEDVEGFRDTYPKVAGSLLRRISPMDACVGSDFARSIGYFCCASRRRRLWLKKGSDNRAPGVFFFV